VSKKKKKGLYLAGEEVASAFGKSLATRVGASSWDRSLGRDEMGECSLVSKNKKIRRSEEKGNGMNHDRGLTKPKAKKNLW
jgi:hypothetical protein